LASGEANARLEAEEAYLQQQAALAAPRDGEEGHLQEWHRVAGQARDARAAREQVRWRLRSFLRSFGARAA
jgi:hypothetical protein